ncbi:MAG: alpha/beta fold hydrolase, partial [Solirubrobacterales bacterium]
MSSILADTDLTHGRTEGEVSLHYVEAGGGAPILFMHGFPQFWFLWRHQLAELSRDFHCVAPDMRGFNLSDKPPDPEDYRMRHLLGDVEGLVEQLGWERFTLVGHDWGGIVSWA